MKKILYLAMLAISFMTLNSCDDDSIEVKDLSFITADAFKKDIVVVENSNLDTQVTIFTSKKMGSDTTINLNVTTSMNADNYTVPASVTIPKGDNKVVIPINFTDSSLNRMGETMSISFDGPEGYFEGNSKVDFNISVLCPSDLAGSWTYTNGNGKTVSITQTGDGTYSIGADNAFGGNYPFYISDACSNITVTGGFLADNFGIPVSGSGTVSADKSTITLTYTAEGYFTDRSMILSKN
ncbi:lipoprotein precursor [Tenacibaculum sp. 190130A14a]|uniref:Calx-beta domain-containing protein n=1 Tax=Tenacibaculum polynesiense TaxID=3137857 RepID=A0ABP1EXD4_9FLAO